MKTDNWQASHYAKHGRFVSELHQYLLSDLAPKSGEHILDLGCGDGEIAEVLSDLGCEVIGIDSSANLIARAKSRGVNAVLGDAQSLTFVNRFDAVSSNAAIHWMPDQDAVCSSVYRALKPGGRFVGEMGGNGNISKIQTALAQALSEFGYDFCKINPWTFPTADEHTMRLETVGFHVQKSVLRARPTILPTNLKGWIHTFTEAIFNHIADEDKGAVIARTIEIAKPALQNPKGDWVADYVRLNFMAQKPA